MRLIDVDAMHKPTYAEDDNITGYGMTQEERDSYNEGIRYALRLVANCPTVNAVPIVRCGECKRREEKTFWCEKVQDFISNPEWFCADGKPKGGNK